MTFSFRAAAFKYFELVASLELFFVAEIHQLSPLQELPDRAGDHHLFSVDANVQAATRGLDVQLEYVLVRVQRLHLGPEHPAGLVVVVSPEV